MRTTVGIIGVGNMGEALLAGLLAAGTPKSDVIFAQRSEERAKVISERYAIAHKSLAEVTQSDVVLLCVKPKDVAALCEEIKESLKPGNVIVSVAAGKTIAGIAEILGSEVAVIRVMPNTPTFIGKGAAGISLGKNVTKEQSAFVHNFLKASGLVVEVPEDLQAAVTATSGSGPAYFFAFVEAMVAGGMKLGLTEEIATQLTVQTIIGASGMLAESGKSAKELRENVTSPNGTTFAALTTFEEKGLTAMVEAAMAASAKRSQELA
jgi:pyrroline-5-carboxylate reductase